MARRFLPFTLLYLFTCGQAHAETVTVSVDVDPAQLADDVEPGRVPFGNLFPLALPGRPGTWGLPLLVLMPPDTSRVDAVRVERRGCLLLPGAETAVAGRVILSLQSGDALPIAVPHALDAQGPLYPAEDFLRLPMMREGDAQMLPLVLFPARLAADLGVVELCRRLEVTVAFDRESKEPFPNGHTLLHRLTRFVANPDDLPRWYQERKREGETYDLVIILPDFFKGASKNLDAFLELKKQQGHTPLVVTIEDIEDAWPDPALDRADRIRLWLQEHYKSYGIEYVVLLGSPDDADKDAVPMKTCYPARGWETEGVDDVPTDLYFGDLTGNWNPDGDEFPCEYEDYQEVPDDAAPDSGDPLDGVDIAAEVLVGRIPHFGKFPDYADGTLARLTAYEQASADVWHNRALLPMPMVTFPNGSYVDASVIGQYLINKSLAPAGIGHAVLVEKEGNLVSSLPGDDQISWETLQAWWNQGNGIVFWCAHGNEEGACRDIWYQDPNGNGLPEQMETTEPMFIDTQFPKLVTEDFPPVVFEASCLNGNPQAHGNLAHTLLQRVTVGNVASSRITIGTVGETQGSTPWRLSPFDPGAFSLGVYFTHSLAVSRKPLGEALRAARTTLTFGAQPWTFKTQLEFNLYGDPCLVLPACSDDSQCNDSNPCSGEESCQDGKCQAGIAVVCPQPDTPLDECSQIQCLPDDGCVTVFKEDFTRCAASDPCASAGFCEQGRCKVAPKICPPTGNPCTLSSCHEVTGNCLSHPLPDGIPCAVLGTEGACAAGECVLPRPEPDLLPDAQPDVQPEVGAAETVEAPPPQPRGCAAGAAGTIPSLALLLLAALALARAGHARVHAGGRSDV